MNVANGINCKIYKGEVNKSSLISSGFKTEYFEEKDKKFTPAIRTFTSDSYKEFLFINYMGLQVQPTTCGLLGGNLLHQH